MKNEPILNCFGCTPSRCYSDLSTRKSLTECFAHSSSPLPILTSASTRFVGPRRPFANSEFFRMQDRPGYFSLQAFVPSLRIACAPRFPDAHLRVELLCAHQMGASSFRFLFNQAREDYLLVIFRARSRSSRTLDDQVQSHSSPGQLSSLSSAFPANGAHNTHSRDEGAERFLQRRFGKVRWFRRGPAGILQGAKQGGGAGFSQRWVSWRQWRKFWKGPKRESGCSPGLQAFDYGVVRGGRGS